jgi:integrase
MSVPTSANYGTETIPGAHSVAPLTADTPPSRAKRNGPRREFVLHAGMVALTPEELEKVLEPVDRLEERALLELAAVTGIRREDVVAIPLEGLDLDRGTLRFYESKKRRTREIPVQGRPLVTLRTYVRGLPKGERWLFPSPRKTGKHQTGRFAWTIWNRWLDRAGLPRRPFHALRATAYKLAKARGWSVELASALLGDTIRVAQEFYGVATPGELLAVARERPLL